MAIGGYGSYLLLTAGGLGLTSPSARASSCAHSSNIWYLSGSYVYFKIIDDNDGCSSNGTSTAEGWTSNCGASTENINIDVWQTKQTYSGGSRSGESGRTG
jgi:hypothetical protein